MSRIKTRRSVVVILWLITILLSGFFTVTAVRAQSATAVRPQSAEARLAAQIASARSGEEQQALLDANRDLINSELEKSLLAEGWRLWSHSSYPQSRSIFELVERLANQTGDKASLAGAYRGTGTVDAVQARFAEALEYYQKCLKLYQELGDKEGIATSLRGAGNVRMSQGNNKEAMENYQASLGLSRELGNKGGVATTLNNIGNLMKSQGDYKQALAYYQESLQLETELGDKAGIERATYNIGAVQIREGQYQAAEDSFQKSLKLEKELGDRAGTALTLSYLGAVRGTDREALEYYDEALKIQQEVGDRAGAAYTLSMIGNTRMANGAYLPAWDAFQKCLKISQEIGLKAEVAAARANIGVLLYARNAYEQALDSYQAALEIFRQLGDKEGTASMLNDIANIRETEGNFQEAESLYEQSLKIKMEIGNKLGSAGGLGNIGRMKARQGAFKQALEYYQKALEIFQAINNKSGIGKVHLDLSDAYWFQGDYVRAAEFGEKAATFAKQTGNNPILVDALTSVARTYRALGDLDRAGRNLAEAVAAIERLRNMVGGPELDQQRVLENRINPYSAMADLLIDQNKSAEAFGFAERARARVLLEVLQSGKVNVVKAMTAEEKNQERKLLSQLSSLNSQVLAERLKNQPDQDLLADLTRRLEQARVAYETLQTSIYAAHPELRTQRGDFRPISLTDCSALLPDRNTALLEFLVLEDRTLLFVLTRGTDHDTPDLKAYQIPVKQTELAALCDSFRGRLARRDLNYAEPARKIYDLLLRPAARDVQGKNNMVIVPDGPLWELPFQALQPAPNHFLIQDTRISYAPSLTALREMIKASQTRTQNGNRVGLLALGNALIQKGTLSEGGQVLMGTTLGPLPQAESQVQALGQMYGPASSRVYTGTQATEDKLKSEAGSCRVLHIAAHAIVDNVSPMYSQIILSRAQGSDDDGLLEAWEIVDMDLSADLAVLSACETAGGRVGAGEGMIGLSWAFFVAGCPATVVSQWNVEATSTTKLMVEFHRNLLAGMSKAEALRRAELKLLKTRATSDPFYWAGFVVMGNPN
jgi:CHAT domain-containing protein/Tfp pilus assembly protein PilF